MRFVQDVSDLNRLFCRQSRVRARSLERVVLLDCDAALRHKACGAPCIATTRRASPSHRFRTPNSASQMRRAFSSIAWNTGSSSPGELLMTRSTSDVAVCCSSVSFSLCSSSAIFSYALTSEGLRRRAALAALQLFNALRRCVFTALSRLIASPEAQDKAS